MHFFAKLEQAYEPRRGSSSAGLQGLRVVTLSDVMACRTFSMQRLKRSLSPLSTTCGGTSSKSAIWQLLRGSHSAIRQKAAIHAEVGGETDATDDDDSGYSDCVRGARPTRGLDLQVCSSGGHEAGRDFRAPVGPSRRGFAEAAERVYEGILDTPKTDKSVRKAALSDGLVASPGAVA